jgi:tRNA 2-thiouridine synthesizing protein A
LNAGDRLEVQCTDPLAIIDVPNLIRETGDHVEILKKEAGLTVFLIQKAG